MLRHVLFGTLESYSSVRSQLCRTLAFAGSTVEHHACAQHLGSPRTSAVEGLSFSARSISINSSRTEESPSEGSGSSPTAEQDSVQPQDVLTVSAARAAAAKRLLEKPGPNPHAELDSVPLPDPSKAEQMIADLHAQDPEPPAVVNFAGTHSPGWKVVHVDEEAYAVWWVLDLTGGRIPWADRNAKLSDRAKYYMYRLNKFGGWSIRNIARLFNVRQERVMAIVALQQMDAEARERGDPLFDELQEMADSMYGATEMRGTGERHIRLLPTKPAFEVLDRQEPGKREEEEVEYQFPMSEGEDPDDPGWESEVRLREEEVGRYEGRILAREFKHRLAYNLGLTGKTISRASLKKQPPKRPAEGWSLVVRPVSRGQDYEPFVAKPDSTRRALTEDEALYLRRMKPLPRRRIL